MSVTPIWEKVGPYLHRRVCKDVVLEVTLTEEAEWAWNALRNDRVFTGCSGYANHQQAIGQANSWVQTHMGMS